MASVSLFTAAPGQAILLLCLFQRGAKIQPFSGLNLEEGMATHSSVLAWRVPMDRIAWQATVHGVTKSWTGLND